MLAARILFVFVGAYAVASAAAILLAALPGDRGQNVTGATLAALLVWVGAAVWIFAVRSMKRALLGVVGSSALMCVLALLLERAR